jgi:hypothetical protein
VLQLQQQLLAQRLCRRGQPRCCGWCRFRAARRRERRRRTRLPAGGGRRRHALLQQHLLLLEQHQVLLLRRQLLLLRDQQRLLLRLLRVVGAAAAAGQPLVIQAGEAVPRGDEVRGVRPGPGRRCAARQHLLKGSCQLGGPAPHKGRR